MNEPHDTAVLISINSHWCQLIASGKKTIEVRKTRPQIKTPFKCYIYCTKDNKAQFWIAKTYFYLDDHAHNAFDKCGNGTVIGEFVCDRVFDIELTDEGYDFDVPKLTGLKYEELEMYLDRKRGYGWHISNLRIYEHPKKLSDFSKPCPNKKICIFCDHHYTETTDNDGRCIDPGGCSYFEMDESKIKRAPQSWSYIEEV